jgi:hypothetical protein
VACGSRRICAPIPGSSARAFIGASWTPGSPEGKPSEGAENIDFRIPAGAGFQKRNEGEVSKVNENGVRLAATQQMSCAVA